MLWLSHSSQGGINIPFDVTFNGNRKEGTVKIASGVPTFTEGAASQAQSDSTKAVSK